MTAEMTEGSPIVPSESQILELPIFPNGAPAMNFAMSQLTSRTIQRITQYHNNYSHSLTDLEKRRACGCPHVLVSDDDPFQNFYYETMFQRSISWEEILSDQENFRFELFLSGEELVKRYNKIKNCGCGKPMLVITDYDMGQKRMNGLDTVKTLRKSGFKGAMLLRTSEDKEYLLKKHVELAEMLKTQKIDCYLEKNNFKKAKEVIQSIIKNMKK